MLRCGPSLCYIQNGRFYIKYNAVTWAEQDACVRVYFESNLSALDYFLFTWLEKKEGFAALLPRQAPPRVGLAFNVSSTLSLASARSFSRHSSRSRLALMANALSCSTCRCQPINATNVNVCGQSFAGSKPQTNWPTSSKTITGHVYTCASIRYSAAD